MVTHASPAFSFLWDWSMRVYAQADGDCTCNTDSAQDWLRLILKPSSPNISTKTQKLMPLRTTIRNHSPISAVRLSDFFVEIGVCVCVCVLCAPILKPNSEPCIDTALLVVALPLHWSPRMPLNTHTHTHYLNNRLAHAPKLLTHVNKKRFCR